MRLNDLLVARLAVAFKGPLCGETRNFARLQNQEFRGGTKPQ
jgi:hypothetical protein